jgi:hypothetical protein
MEYNKIGFAILGFSVNLYAIYKLQAKPKKSKESNFTHAPRNS